MQHTIIPTGGLANRIRVVLSALQWSHDTGLPIRILWVPDSALACRYSRIFNPVNGMKESGKWRIYLYRFLKKLSKLGLLNGIKTFTDNDYEAMKAWALHPEGRLYAKSFTSFYQGTSPRYVDLFTLTPEVEQMVKEATADIDAHTVGVHIRRTDNAASISHSPLALFEARMQEEMAADSLVRFYLATDDPLVQQWATEQFGDRIIIHQGPLNRNSEAGILHAVIELYTLASCNRILGSYCSSFSELAAEIGGITLEIVK